MGKLSSNIFNNTLQQFYCFGKLTPDVGPLFVLFQTQLLWDFSKHNISVEIGDDMDRTLFFTQWTLDENNMLVPVLEFEIQCHVCDHVIMKTMNRSCRCGRTCAKCCNNKICSTCRYPMCPCCERMKTRCKVCEFEMYVK
jgi:hypothetical protein